MKIKSLVAGALVAMMAHGTASAYDMMWFDRNAGIDRFQKVVVFPMADGGRNNFFSTDMKPYSTYNYELHKRLTRHAKGITFYELFDTIIEKKETAEAVPESVRNNLLKPFPTESARAEGIMDAFAADGYIVPYFRERRIQVDHSPAAYDTVTMDAYTEVRGAPNDKYDGERSTYTYDVSRWQETVYIPEAYLNRYITVLEFTMFDEDGKKIFTCMNRRHSYSNNFDDQYKDMKDDFADDLKDIKKNKDFIKHQESNKAPFKIKIGNLSLPENVGNDEYKLKSCWYLFKNHTMSMKNMKAVEGDGSDSANYRVEGNISRYTFEPRWVAPYASVSHDVQWTKDTKWKDTKGREHTQTVTRYVPRAVPHHGYYAFDSASSVRGSLTLYNNKTGAEVFTEYINETDDKEVDAWTHGLKKFFKKADKYAAERMGK